MSNSWRMRPRIPRRGARIGGELFTILSALQFTTSVLHAQQPSASERDSISRAARALEKVTVTAIRGGDAAPISAKTLGREEIERRYFGQDVPLVLQSVPSLTSYAETG